MIPVCLGMMRAALDKAYNVRTADGYRSPAYLSGWIAAAERHGPVSPVADRDDFVAFREYRHRFTRADYNVTVIRAYVAWLAACPDRYAEFTGEAPT